MTWEYVYFGLGPHRTIGTKMGYSPKKEVGGTKGWTGQIPTDRPEAGAHGAQ